MSLNTNFNVNPYHDDFNDEKGFVRLLFKPGYAVQARELTQIQSTLQNQVNKFGNHIFKNGSLVTGGEFFLHQATYIEVANTYVSGTSTFPVNVQNFDNKTIYVYSGDSIVKEAKVLKTYDFNPGTGDPKTFLVAQTLGDSFTPSETVQSATSDFATVLSSGNGLLFSVNEGVFYYDGFFIRNAPQTIAVSKYSTNDANASARIGFEVIESIVKSTDDSSLLDPAQDASNYQAPGSDRYKIELVLAARDLSSTDTTKFIELMRVENGVILSQNKFPIYSVIEDTLARRTYDESGNYTVRPFQISLETNSANSAQTNVILSPGKAYVFGYEYETISPTKIVVDKPRETESVANDLLSTEYGYFVYTTKHRGTFPINTLSTVSLHCVPNSSIDRTSASSISNTKIGTARVKTIAFDDSQEASNSSSYVYRTFLFDVKTDSIQGNVINATSTTVTLGNSTFGLLSSINDAYKGANFRILSGNGSTEMVKVITGWNGATQVATLSDVFTVNSSTIGTSSNFSIDFDVGDVESLVIHDGTSIVAAADIDNRSKDFANPYQKVFVTERDKEPLIFKIKNDYIKEDSISDITYRYKRLYENVNFTSNTATLTSLSGQQLIVDSSGASKRENFYVAVTSKGTSPYSVGTIIPSSKISSIGSSTITIDDAGNMTANIIATVRVNSGDLTTQRMKQFISPVSTSLSSSSGTDVFANGAVVVYPSNGEVRITSTYTAKNSNDVQSLFLSDVTSIVKIVDLGNNDFTTTNLINGTDITSRYVLDNGQRDSYYDHASIKLKPKAVPPTGNVVVFCNTFIHQVTDGGGYFSVDSYTVPYEDVPTYTSSSGKTYNLRDCLDFRPSKVNGNQFSAFNVRSSSSQPGPGIPIAGEDFNIDYSYYLPRTDKVVLGKDRQFRVLKGVSSLSPAEPKDPDSSMTLFVLKNPPYVGDTSEVSIRHIDHKRYTMRDIGKIEKRVDSLEYYTTLSLIEQSTLTQQDFSILDSQNLSRFKNGILVDGLTGFAVSDVENPDYSAAIDRERKELRPKFTNDSLGLTFDKTSSSNFLVTSSGIITKSSTPVAFIDQSKASLAINVNPFNVLRFDGNITLEPKSDIWVETQTKPDVVIDMSGDMAAWNLIAADAFSTTYGNWNENWFGVDPVEQWNQTGIPVPGVATRTVTKTKVVPERVTKNIGERVVDISVIPLMRNIEITFIGNGFKPSTILYPFFDNIDISNKCHSVNRITVNTTPPALDPEFNYSIQITGSTGFNLTGGVIAVSNNVIHFYPDFVSGTMPSLNNLSLTIRKFPGNSVAYQASGSAILSYEHYFGANMSVAPNTTSLTLKADAKTTNTSLYVGKKITFVPWMSSIGGNGSFVFFSSTITGYDPNTNTVTLSSVLQNTNQTLSGTYFIGNSISTDNSGSIAGIFYCPGGIFKTGEKSFRLINSQTNDTGSATSFGDVKFLAQGTIQTKESTIISTTVPKVVSETTTQTKTVYYDPLAQTFAVDPVTYPRGLFLNKIRLCFKSKSKSAIPVRLEIRPTVNGFPDSRTTYPYSTVELFPKQVNVTESPSLDDSTKYTEFVFPSPVYLLPGEHAIVLISNSNEYEVYCAEIGKIDLATNQVISEQPYGGSLFKSQNASTWTPEQNFDMMFRLFRHSFSTEPSTLYFNIQNYSNEISYPYRLKPDAPLTFINRPNLYQEKANSVYDVVSLLTSDLKLPETDINYEFNSYSDTGTPQLVGFKSIVPGINYELDDDGGRRILYHAAGNNAFVLKATLENSYNDVSPVIDFTHLGVFLIKNKISNLGLSNSDFVIANTGLGYSSGNVVVSVTGGGAIIDAQPVANVTATGAIDKIYFPDEASRGVGYTSTPTITVAGTNTYPIIVSVDGEDQKNGGIAEMRHLTKIVTLADGFDSADLRVYLTAYKPLGSHIQVYCKILSESDIEPFSEKKWILLTQLGSQNIYSVNKNEYREFVFAPGTNGVADNFISYDSYTSFKTFQIKIVMGTDNPTNPPKVTDIRAIALPDGR